MSRPATPRRRSSGKSERTAREAARPSSDEVARRAYELYQTRGGEHGHDLDDWLQAERELQPATVRRPAQRKSARGKSSEKGES